MTEEFERRIRRQAKIAKAIKRKARESGREITGRNKVVLTRLNGRVAKQPTRDIGDIE